MVHPVCLTHTPTHLPGKPLNQYRDQASLVQSYRIINMHTSYSSLKEHPCVRTSTPWFGRCGENACASCIACSHQKDLGRCCATGLLCKRTKDVPPHRLHDHFRYGFATPFLRFLRSYVWDIDVGLGDRLVISYLRIGYARVTQTPVMHDM